MRKNAILFTVLMVLAGGLVWQHAAIRSLRSELAQLTKVSRDDKTAITAPTTSSVLAADLNSDSEIMRQRLSAMEEQVHQLTLASELLMERGQLPLSAAKAAELRRNFLNSSLPDRERLRALRILRRNHAIDDEVLLAGLAWIEMLADTQLIGDVLEQFIGLKSLALRDKALQLVATHPDDQVRRRAAQILGGFDDPAVESAIWTALVSEQSPEVQNQLADALRDRPMNPTRQAELDRRVLDNGASFRERFAAFRVLISAKAANAQTTAAFANEVVAQNNPEQMADLFRTLDNTGNLAAAPALISGLQVDDPGLRGLALDALSEMQAEPAVVKWPQYTANNDSDERVRAEAVRVLAQAGNKP